MRSFKKYKALLIVSLIFTGFGVAMPAAVSAAPLAPTTFAAACEDVTPQNSTKQLEQAREKGQKENFGLRCITERYVNPAIALMSGIAGVAVVISIVLGGIQYSAAGGDPGKVAAARNRISKAIIALLAFLFLFAFLNWLLPGGIGN